VALVGLEGRIVEVKADIGAGLPRTVLVGLPDSALYPVAVIVVRRL
jgi:magnesium chelatase family protein